MARLGKQTAVYGVVPHCERQKATGRGYVVRPYESGQFWDQYNYGGIAPVKLYRSLGMATRAADKLDKTAKA